MRKYYLISAILMVLINHYGYADNVITVSPSELSPGKPHALNITSEVLTSTSNLILSPARITPFAALTTGKRNFDLTASNQFAYIAAGKSGLAIVDLKNPSDLKIANRAFSENNITKIAINENMAYLVDGEKLLITSIEDAVHPKLIATYSSETKIIDVAADREHLFLLTQAAKLIHLKINASFTLNNVHDLILDNAPRRIKLVNQHLFIANEQSGLEIYQFQQSGPKLLGRYRTNGPALDVSVTENIAIIANGSRGITLLDVSDPTRINWISSHQQLGNITKLHLSNNFVFALNQKNKIFKIDFSNPAVPTLRATLRNTTNVQNLSTTKNDTLLTLTNKELISYNHDVSTPIITNEGMDFGQGINFGGQRRIVIRHNIAYVADWFSGIHLYDISNPKNISLLSSYATDGSPKGIILKDQFAIVADDDHGIVILDIQNPYQPKKVSTLLTPGLAYTPVLHDNFLFLASHHGGFQIIDISDIRHPQLLSSTDTLGKSWSIRVKNNTAYIADDDEGLLIYDIENKSNPTKIARYQPGGAVEDVLIDNNLAYLSIFDQGLQIIDVTNPKQIKLISAVKTPGNARGLDQKDHFIYIADWLSGIQVIDALDKKHPKLIGSFDTDGAAWGISIQKNSAFIADWWGGFKALDISQPENITLKSRYVKATKINDLILHRNFAYASYQNQGVHVFDINNPLNPTWVTGINVPGENRKMARLGQFIYLSSDQNTVNKIDISSPFSLSQSAALKLDHAVDDIAADEDRIIFAKRERAISVINKRHPNQLQKLAINQFIVNDLDIEDGRLAIASAYQGLQLYDLDQEDNAVHIQTIKTETAFSIVKLTNNRLYAYEKKVGITLYKEEKGLYIPVFTLPIKDTIRDFSIIENTLQVLRNRFLIDSYGIDKRNQLRPLFRYHATSGAKQIKLYRDIFYLFGQKTLSAFKTLPPFEVSTNSPNSRRLDLPSNYPVGEYRLTIKNPNREYELEKAFKLSSPSLSIPGLSQQKFEK